MKEILTPVEVAKLLKISKAGVYRLVEQRRIRFYKVMGSLRFAKDDILSYLEQNGFEPIGATQHGDKKD